MWTILLLIGSNIFMTFAWYGHLKFREVPLGKVILVSWGIAFFEYCLQVPANRIGAKTFSPDQLKVIQEVITLTVFGVFSTFYFGDKLHWNHFAAFGCLVAGRSSCSINSMVWWGPSPCRNVWKVFHRFGLELDFGFFALGKVLILLGFSFGDVSKILISNR
jgi:uncharacterized protein (DUF486 family)